MTTDSTAHRPAHSPLLPSQVVRTAIVGTGYIAEFHARAIRALQGIELIGVCDTNMRRAQSFADEWGVPAAYDSAQQMLEREKLDAVHVLVPPDAHHPLAKTVLQAGINVFLEKPLCTSTVEADELVAMAQDRGLLLGVNHNFLFAGAYQRLREAVRSGQLGPLDHVSFNYFFELGQIRFGPYDSWMLRAPENLLLETGPHLLSAVLDLVGTPDAISVAVDRRAVLPGGAQVFRRWRVQATVGATAVDININLAPGFAQRTILARGLLGAATLDFEANTCTIDRRTPLSADLDRYRRTVSVARQLRSQARTTLRDSLLTKLKLRKSGNPYEASIVDSVAAFYSGLRSERKLDRRIDGAFGRDVIDWCGNVIQSANIEPRAARGPTKPARSTVKPSVLVIGGAGFIGRELIRQLLEAGYGVRAMMRGSGAVLEDLDNGRLEIIRGDARRQSDLDMALRGIEFVYDLATSETKTWNSGVQNIVEPARRVGEACLAAGVKRLIYTGTIDSYYAGAKAGTITEQTPLDRNIRRRNYYARAKAASETVLLDLHRTRQLPVVIFRPGIVIGQGGNPFHWGVGRFSEGVCEVWGDGNNKLPFVLVSDVAAALVRGMQTTGIEGRSYNLVDVPLLSARDYLQELQKQAGIALTVHYRPIWRFYLTDLAKWVVKLAVGHPDRERIPSYRDWESRTQKAVFDCTRARDDLGWAPASDRQRLVNEGIGGSIRLWLEAVGGSPDDGTDRASHEARKPAIASD